MNLCFYAHVRDIPKNKAEKILEIERFTYNFGDGWVAAINVSRAKNPASIRRKSNGFCGYEWMIGSIVEKLKIEVPER